MPGSEGKSVQRTMPRAGIPAALVAILAATLACTTAGCFLPLLTAIPSVINLAHSIAKGNNPDDPDAVAKNPDGTNQDAENQAAEEPTKPAPQLTPANMCQMMAIARPDMVLVELRKNSAGAPEYRELHLQNSTDEAHWTPTIDNETGADGWMPAVNFLKMDFNPPLTAAIPASGTSYLAYAPTAFNPNDPTDAQIKPPSAGNAGTFTWAGRVYQYTVASTPPCLAPSSLQAAATR
jgi:hypothetical protein